MNISKFLICSSLALSLSGCDYFSKKPEAETTTGLGNKETKEEIIQMRKIAGRWKSPIAPLPGFDTRWFSLDLSNDKKAGLEIRSAGNRFDIIHSTATGDIELTDSGFKGTLKGGSGKLEKVEEISGRLTDSSTLRVKTSIGVIDFQYSGR